jgi:hypothetical protein
MSGEKLAPCLPTARRQVDLVSARNSASEFWGEFVPILFLY